MKDKLPLAKITPPRSDGIQPRSRLFRFLDRGRSRFPMTWVMGPPGSGKTMLVASYVHARRLPCLWYQMDEGDGDISTFFYYLGLAARKLSRGNKKPLPLLTPEYAMGIPVFSRRFFEEL